MPKPLVLYGLGAAAVLLVLWYVATHAKQTARGAVDLAGNVAGGVIEGIGEQIGIPVTDEAACDAAIRDGRTWDASFACPAKRWALSLVGKDRVQLQAQYQRANGQVFL